jgi:hypothetical protein
LAGVFWLVVAVPFAIVGRITSGVVSAVFWGLAGLWALLAVINFAYFAAGKDRGGGKKGPPKDWRGPQS